jgi:outer membrane immunogenic protein
MIARTLKSFAAGAALAAGFALAAAPAHAQSAGLYVNGGYTHFDADAVELGGLTGRVGYNFTPYVGAEGEVSFGISDDGNVELDNEIGVFAVARWPFQDRFDLFARAGVSRVEVTGGDDEGFAFGIGGNYYFTAQDGVRADYTRHSVDDAGGDIDAFSVSYVRRF